MASATQQDIAQGTLGRRIITEKLHLQKLVFTRDYKNISYQQNLLTMLEEALALLTANYDGGCQAITHKQAAADRRLQVTMDLGRFDLASQVAGEADGWSIARHLLAHMELEELAGS
jgi:hypothetical protein